MNQAARISLGIAKWLGIVLGALLLLYFALLLFFNFNWLKEPLSKRVHEQTGRDQLFARAGGVRRMNTQLGSHIAEVLGATCSDHD